MKNLTMLSAALAALVAPLFAHPGHGGDVTGLEPAHWLSEPVHWMPWVALLLVAVRWGMRGRRSSRRS